MKNLVLVLIAVFSISQAYAEGGHGMGRGGGWGARGGMERGGGWGGRGGMERGGDWGRGGWGRDGWGRGGWEGGGWGWGGWGWGDNWIFPALVGGAIVYDMNQPQTVYVQPSPAYDSGNAVNAVPAPVQYWYYCASANAYYPYVPSCPTGWQAVPATPPPPLSRAPAPAR